jgi:uncharacterized protein YodC (DUF2158 family)
MSQFQKGDKVQLKSGGQVMTISNLGDYEGTDSIKDGALCVWFDKTGKAREKVFDVSVLEAQETSFVKIDLNLSNRSERDTPE